MREITRRRFLKLGLASASLAAGGASFYSLSEGMELSLGGRHVSRLEGKPQKGILSTCLQCYARCGIIGYVAHGQLVKIGGNPDHPNSRGKMCAKGQAGRNFLYDPDRVLHPLKRVGPRGEGRFKRVTWDEALGEVAETLKKLRAGGHPDRFLFQSSRDVTTQAFSRRFVWAFGSPNALVNTALGHNNKAAAQLLTWGEEVEINDVANTRFMLNFGSNPYEAHLLRTSFAQRIAEGRITRLVKGIPHFGAKLVTFDPRNSQTAGKSDEWFPIRPGTDGVVALAIAHVIMEEGLFDRAFMESWANYPVEELKEYLKAYTPEAAERASGVLASDIRRIALEYVASKPATTISTGGVSKHLNGTYNERCIMLLNALTGNIDVKGGFCLPRHYAFREPEPSPPRPQAKSPFIEPGDIPLSFREPAHEVLRMIGEGRGSAGLLMLYEHNPVYCSPDRKLSEKVLSDEKLIPHLVVIDSHMTETALFADLLLPGATYLERWELDSPPAFELVPFVSLRQPVVKPLGESASCMDILIRLAKKVGGGMERFFPFARAEDYWEAAIAGVEGLPQAGGLYSLSKKGFWYDEKAEPRYRSYEVEGFKTPSGKFELFSQRLKDLGFSPLPAFEPIPAHRKMAGDEFHLIVFQWNVHTHFRTANCMYLSEVVPNNPMWINAEVAHAMGIKSGDLVEVSSDLGSLRVRAHVTQGIHPRVVAISDSVGHWALGRIAQAKRFKSRDPNTKIIWWDRQGNGVHPFPIVPLSPDPIGGGQAWMDTVVRIKKH